MLGYQVDDSGREQYNKGIDQTKQKQQSLTGAFIKANVIMGVAQKALGAAIGYVRDTIIGGTLEMEGYRNQMAAFTGDADSAAEALAHLRDKTIDPLFGTGNLVNAHNQLRTIGLTAEQTSRMIDVLGDCANGSAENFNALNTVLLRTKTTGKVNTMTMRQLAQAGFGAQDMAQGLGISVEQLNRDVEAGRIGFNELARAMEGATQEGGRFYMNAEKQARTLTGAIRIIKDTFNSIGDAIGTKVAPAAAELINYINQLVKLGKGKFIDAWVKVFENIIHWIYQVIIMWEVLQYRLEDIGAFEVIGKFFDDLKYVAGKVLTGVMKFVVDVGKTFFTTFKSIYGVVSPIIRSLGDLIQKVLNFAAKGIGGLVPLINMLKPPLAVVGAVLSVIITGLGGIIDFLSPLAPLIFGIIAVIKIWTFVQWLLNAAMMANPIGLIVAAVIAAVALIVGLVMTIIKNWEKIKEFFVKLWNSIKEVFTKAWEGIKNIFGKVGEFFSGIWNGIKGAASKAWNGVKNVTGKAWEGIKGAAGKAGGFLKKNWKSIAIGMVNPMAGGFKFLYDNNEKFRNAVDKTWGKIKDVASNVWTGIKNVANKAWAGMKKGASAAWEGIKGASGRAWEGIKNGASAAAGFFKDRWGDIKNAGGKAFDFLDEYSGGALTKIKDNFLNIVNKIKEFFTGLWSAIKEGPAEAIEYIKNAFFGLFESIKEKFFGFIDTIKEGWEKVKGFFGGIGQGVKNIFGGGDKSNESGGGQLQPAFAGTPAAAAAATVGQTSNYAYTNTGGSSTVNANTSINVNVPQGTPQEQAEAISRQINQQFNERLAGEINSSRADIPSPEVRRH